MSINVMLQNTVVATLDGINPGAGADQNAPAQNNPQQGNEQGNNNQTTQGEVGYNGNNDTTTGSGGFFSPMMILIWVGMFAAMYFFLFRPQRKRDKQMKEMQSALRVGDNVLTSGGIYGKIAGVGEDAFMVEFGENRGVRVWVRKSDVLGVKAPSTTPPPAEPVADKIEDKKAEKVEDKKDDK